MCSDWFYDGSNIEPELVFILCLCGYSQFSDKTSSEFQSMKGLSPLAPEVNPFSKVWTLHIKLLNRFVGLNCDVEECLILIEKRWYCSPLYQFWLYVYAYAGVRFVKQWKSGFVCGHHLSDYCGVIYGDIVCVCKGALYVFAAYISHNLLWISVHVSPCLLSDT